MSSQAPFLELTDQFDVKLANVKAIDVLAIEIDHVPVGNPALSAYGQQAEAVAPGKGILTDQAIVTAVKLLDKPIRKIERKSARRRAVQP